ncbi:hypothetical protein TRICI_002444 [Trichomonascus ciferrii]|uniref:Uncharacterized protein n=1 Tax=Trichomonascus ciferrii TaxID=44093 RepID=A0A642V6S0_9ASCO|nr:hypothetical protein TRICI_002444 [Trichomonascus ciferrii]
MPVSVVESKKRRVDNDSTGRSKAVGSRIFAPFRTIGLVTNATPFSVTALGQSFIITASVGRTFQIFDASTLHLLFVSSPQAPGEITCLHSHFHHVFAAWGHTIGIYKRGKLQATLQLGEDVEQNEGSIKSIVTIGEYLCASTDSGLYVFNVNVKNLEEAELYTSFKVPKVSGNVKSLLHMPTYLNKVVIVTDTNLLLYNVRTGKLVFTSQEFGGHISAVESSPALDTLAVATASGDVHLYNLKKDKVLFTLGVGEKINTLSFRTDGTPHLGMGTAAGDMFFYDLNARRRLHSVRGSHDEAAGGVSNIHFLAGQPIVVSGGGDNLIQELVFDQSISTTNVMVTSPPRVLRSRGGHSRPPNTISFTDEEAHFILSGSQDQSLWSFSLRKDSQSHEFSQRTSANKKNKKSSLREKFPEITSLAFEADKQRRWDNIVTAHKNTSFARTWSGERGIVGSHQLATADGQLVKSVAITQCGNFGLVGSSGGSIAVYNLQSGILRRRITKAHSKAVTGLAVDTFNRTIISCSLDGKVALHDFRTGKLINVVTLDSSATEMRLHGNLLGVVLDNLSIVVIDITTRKLVRELWGHENRITSFDFTVDGRWIISAGLDSTIRTWDIPSGGCIDAVRVPSVVTCLRVSPNGEWLATAHVQGVGIQLWTQKSQFSKVAVRHISEDEVRDMDLPNVAGEGGANIVEGAFDEEDENVDTASYTSPAQLDEKLLTLSLQPRSKFNTLRNLEAIKLRNKPKEAPKAPEKAPFFLGDASEAKKRNIERDSHDERAPLQSRPQEFESTFTRLLRERDFDELISHLKSLSPSATDMEIRSLDTYPPLEEFVTFIDALTHQLQRKQDYELIQVWMSMLLRTHGDVILEYSDMLEASLRAWELEQRAEAQRLDSLVKYCNGVISFLRTA